eukprot:UN07364
MIMVVVRFLMMGADRSDGPALNNDKIEHLVMIGDSQMRYQFWSLVEVINITLFKHEIQNNLFELFKTRNTSGNSESNYCNVLYS